MDNRPRTDIDGAIDLDEPSAYGAAFADIYDQWYHAGASGHSDLAHLVSFISARCPSGPVVELGVGSGRLAVPLIEHGLSVIGIDASMPMLSRCPAAVHRVAADMAALPFNLQPADRFAARDVEVARPTVFCGFNTLFNLQSRQRLRTLLTEIATLKATFIVELLNADLLDNAPERSTGPSSSASTTDGVVVTSTRIDHEQQTLTGCHLEITDHNVISRPWLLRWITLAELDHEAQAAGLAMSERYSDWDNTPFLPENESAISVYRPDGSGGGP